MPGEILRRPQARLDLIDIWNYTADDNEAAADRMLDRIGGVLRMLSEQRRPDASAPNWPVARLFANQGSKPAPQAIFQFPHIAKHDDWIVLDIKMNSCSLPSGINRNFFLGHAHTRLRRTRLVFHS
jgi:hypothetical protein